MIEWLTFSATHPSVVGVAHWSALAPLVYLVALRRDADSAMWIVALAFAVSWFADAGAHALGDSWALTYVYPSVQMGLFAWAFGAVWALPVLVTLAAIQVSATTLDGPEVMVRTLGAMIALYVSIGHPLVWSILAYCGLATGLYLLMTTEMWRPAYMPLWYGYQGSRLLAFGFFIREARRA